MQASPGALGRTVWRRSPGALCPLAVVALLFCAAPNWAAAQGCVAARGAGMPCGNQGVHLGEPLPPVSGFQASVAYRWLRSDRTFVGDEEQEQVDDQHLQPINDSHFIDFSLSYSFNPRFSATVVVPFVAHQRSQVVLDPQVAAFRRYKTHASGLGDMRFSVNGWILDPSAARAGNVLLGIGVDVPSGEDNVRDTVPVLQQGELVQMQRTVDQSIQPGDGGWGLVLELYAYRALVPRLNGYLNGSYTITPEEENGVPTFIRNRFEDEMSIADSYLGRGGLEFLAWPRHALIISVGARVEGVRVDDAVGGSDGFRRPGYAVSIEPGLVLPWGTWLLNLYTPVALYRNREQSVAEKQLSAATGFEFHGDASFADVLVSFSVTKRFE